MPNNNGQIIKAEFSAYLFVMHKVFPESSDRKGILIIKNRIDKNYYPLYYKDKPSFRKTIDRNWNFIKDIRKGDLKEVYLPKVDTVEVFISYAMNSKQNISLGDFVKQNTAEIEEYYKENKPSSEILDQIFPLLHEKLVALENRIHKLEEMADEYVNRIKNRLLSNNDDKLLSYSEMFGESKLALEFFNFLEADLLKARKKLGRAQYLHKNLGGLGLFFITKPNLENFDQGIWTDFIKYTDDLILMGDFTPEDVDFEDDDDEDLW